MNILQINASARADNSASTRLADKLVRRLIDANAGTPRLTVRTLAVTPHPEQDEATLQALFTPAADRSAAQAERVALDDALIAELQAADVIVLGVPMYNFGVPAQLKNWIDALARAGVTFRYTEKGPVGLVTGKKVYIATTRGGLHRDLPSDTLVPYLRNVLGFLGMSDVDVVYAEGLGMGPEAERAGLASADAQIEELVAA